MTPWKDVAGDPASGLLLIADHASARIPEGVALGVPAETMSQHVAVDIGVAPLARALCAGLGCPGVLGNVSRLVIDLNREEDASGLVPEASDGEVIPGNVGLTDAERRRRLADYWQPYHRRIADKIAANHPSLLISLHSFTPLLRVGGMPRPWEVGVLYNEDARAARIALPLLEAAGIVAGDNQPYSGKLLNATMNRHGEGSGTAYLGLEVRQDLIEEAAGVARWRDRLVPIIAATVRAFVG